MAIAVVTVTLGQFDVAKGKIPLGEIALWMIVVWAFYRFVYLPLKSLKKKG
jgi:hypothetical protein